VGDQLRISAKNLGELTLPDFCPRCFWIKRRVPVGLPYQIFPGIFSSIDSYSKRVIHGYFDRYLKAPGWLAELGEISGYKNPPHHSQFYIIDETTNIKLSGTPDAIFVKPDNSYIIADYKTAKYTGTQDFLFPMYETQLNAYALIGEACGFSPVTDLALIYTEPVTDDETVTRDAVYCEDGFLMEFSAKILKVGLNKEKIPQLLIKARSLLDQSHPPPGREGCKDCEKLTQLFSIL
jgi:hypothetical protein